MNYPDLFNDCGAPDLCGAPELRGEWLSVVGPINLADDDDDEE